MLHSFLFTSSLIHDHIPETSRAPSPPHACSDSHTHHPGGSCAPVCSRSDWMNTLCQPIWWAVLLDLITVVNEGAHESPPVCSAALVTLRRRMLLSASVRPASQQTPCLLNSLTLPFTVSFSHAHGNSYLLLPLVFPLLLLLLLLRLPRWRRFSCRDVPYCPGFLKSLHRHCCHYKHFMPALWGNA